VTLLKEKNQIRNLAILTFTGLWVMVNRVKLGFGFQHPKSLSKCLVHDCMLLFVAIFILGPELPLHKLHFLYSKYQDWAIFELQLPKRPCQHIPQSFSSQLGNIK
jgi:hypothetical protein